MQRNTTQSPTEQRNRHRDEGVVVPDRGGVDTREADFESETRERNQEDGNMNRHHHGPTE